MTEKPHQLAIKYKGSSNSSAHKNMALEWFLWARNICSKVGVNNSAQTQLDKDMKSWKRGDRPSRHQVSKSTHWPTLLFTATTAHSTSTKFHVTIFMCRVFVRLKHSNTSWHVYMWKKAIKAMSHHILCIKLWFSSCQLQISPLYPADKRQSNKVYDCWVEH